MAPLNAVMGCLAVHLLVSVSAEHMPVRGNKVDISINMANTHPVSRDLFGIFFEEINHAGEGGLYAELIQDRSFDALAYTTGFSGSLSTELLLTDELLAAAAAPRTLPKPFNVTGSAKLDASAMLKEEIRGKQRQVSSQPVAWLPLEKSKATLTKALPLNEGNPVALNLTTEGSSGGVVNSGFWGVPLVLNWDYYFSIYIRGDADAKVRVTLRSSGGKDVYASTVFDGISGSWQKFTANLKSNATDPAAELSIHLEEPGSIVIDSLSLFPGGNQRGAQNPWPFREDLLQLLKDLQPRFLRFPGGCYVEGGDWLKNAFHWKTALGPNENRTGHWNDVWGYWSTDGLGLYEYMLMAEVLGAEPVYVVNNGISHQESIPPQDLQPWLDETLDALEFITGPADSKWGSLRADMGRTKPWKLNYLAIGNEDCGRPNYIEDYDLFYTTIKKAGYTDMTLIANCPMLDAAPTELWDWHSYDMSWQMFQRRHEFDGLVRGRDAPVFVSEYAVTLDGGWGNLRGAVAEASFMTNMERNSDIVKMAAYAPLFVHLHDRVWPTNMIVIDNHRAYKTPSYLVQQLFSRFQGELYADTQVATIIQDVHNELVAASTTCQDEHCEKVVVKVVNFASFTQKVTIAISGSEDLDFESKASITSLSGEHPEAENTFDNPEHLALSTQDIKLGAQRNGSGPFTFAIALQPWSVSALELTQKIPPSRLFLSPVHASL